MLPYILEPGELSAKLNDNHLLVIDLGSGEQYQHGHIPGAVHLDVGKLRLGKPPAPGVLPDLKELENTFKFIGLSENNHVVTYDHEFNVGASRLLWTLEAAGHTRHSLLNGGMTAWRAAGFDLQIEPNVPVPGDFRLVFEPDVLADKHYVLESITNPDSEILDARSPQEFNGIKSPSLRHGHIPGAKNLNWLDTIDLNSRKFKPRDQLTALVHHRGFPSDKEIIVHCQTHQRSSHSFVMLRSLGFKRIRGYAGSWSEWGNDPQLPIIQESV